MTAARIRSGSLGLLLVLAWAHVAGAQPVAPSHDDLVASADTETVRLRKKDSLVDGALIGALVGAGSAAPIFLDNECRDDPACYRALAVYGGVGALAGLAIDALVRDAVVVHVAPRGAARRALAVAPIVGRTRKGVRLRLAF